MDATYGVGGHGLLLTMSGGIQVMVDAEGDLILLRRGREAGRISRGTAPATGKPLPVSRHVTRFGEGGPVLECAEGITLDMIAAHVETGLPRGKWYAHVADVMVALPAGVILVPAPPGGDDPYFELHAPGGRNEFISFMPYRARSSELVVRPAPYQTLVRQGVKRDEGRDISYTECAYERDGKRWRQLFYAVPLAAEETVVIRAQASEPTVELLFQAARAAAATLIPLR